MPVGAASKKKKKPAAVAPAQQVKKKKTLKPPTAAGPTASKLAKYSPAGVVGAAVAKAAQKGQAQPPGPNVGGGAMPAASYAQAAAAAQPYGTYLPTILKPGQQAPATPQIQYGGGAPGLKGRIAREQIPAYYQYPGAAAGAAAGGAGAGYAQAPPGVDPGWYKAFQDEHGGMTPEQFYEQTGEGLAEALRDREWSQMFAAQTGYAPTEYDWQLHWYQTRKGYVPSWMHPAPPGPTGAPAQEQKPPTYMPPQIIWR